jgi:hypothetical protein
MRAMRSTGLSFVRPAAIFAFRIDPIVRMAGSGR